MAASRTKLYCVVKRYNVDLINYRPHTMHTADAEESIYDFTSLKRSQNFLSSRKPQNLLQLKFLSYVVGIKFSLFYFSISC